MGLSSGNTFSKPSMMRFLIVVRRRAAVIFVRSKSVSGRSIVVFTVE